MLRKQKITDKGETVFKVNSFLHYPQGFACALKDSIQSNIIRPRGQTLRHYIIKIILKGNFIAPISKSTLLNLHLYNYFLNKEYFCHSFLS